MSDDAAVVWLVDGDAREDAVRALREWARARGLHLSPAPPLGEAAVALHADPAIVDRVDRELERAHEAIRATDADTAERSLARVEAILREHPELPQAAWLRAEAARTWSARWLRVQPRDDARARIAWENAAALDGGRVAGIGETNFPAAPRLKSSIVLEGAGAPRAVLYFDGVRIEPTKRDPTSVTYVVNVAPAEHHVLVSADGHAVFATWIAIAGAEPTPARIRVGDGGSCARELFQGVRREDAHVLAPSVACPEWVAAWPGERTGSVLVARCERDRCGPLLEWRVEPTAALGPPQTKAHAATWPKWGTWTLLGIGAATAASMVLVAAGVFESRPLEPRFVVGGARQE